MKLLLSLALPFFLYFTPSSYAESAENASVVNTLKHSLFNSTKIRASDGNDTLDPQVLAAVIGIFEFGLPKDFHKKLTRLKALYAFQPKAAGKRLAYYDEKREAIVVPGASHFWGSSGKLATRTLYGTLAHEIGHAVIFSVLTAHELARVAAKFGGWPPPTEAQTNFHHPFFLERPYPSRSYNATVFPTSYAFTNIHEWFAENFSRYILEQMSLAPRRGHAGLTQYFKDLLTQ
ncbi:MAG: hypothetical protein AB7T49_08085 [Oligoflexales bacterium]